MDTFDIVMVIAIILFARLGVRLAIRYFKMKREEKEEQEEKKDDKK